jgi:ATP-binding cassette, subfamily B, bacterial
MEATKEKTKPKYNMWQNTWYMLKTAWNGHKNVPLLCMAIAVVSAAYTVAELVITPAILNKIELSSSAGELLITIAAYTGALLLLCALRTYLRKNTLFGRVEVRQEILKRIALKSASTSYSNTLDTDYIEYLKNAEAATGSNSEASEAIWETWVGLLTDIIGFTVYILLLLELDFRIALIIVITSAVSYFASKRINEWGYRHRKERMEYNDKLRYIRGTAQGRSYAKDIRMFGLANWIEELYAKTLDMYSAFSAKCERVQIWGSVIDIVLTFLRNGAAYAYLIWYTLENNLGAAEFLLYFGAVSGFTQWVTGILTEFGTLHKQSLDLNVVRQYLEWNEPFNLTGGEHIEKRPDMKAEIKLENVSYRYPMAEKDTITNLNLTVHAGEKLAIVGLNGAGKTTLIKLICGFLDPTEGRVLFNGKDVKSLNRRDYYALFSAVFQKFSLIDSNIIENIAQRTDGIDEARAWDCAEKAGLSEKIKSLPEGMYTHFGRSVYEDGVELSGGETQRLMLARALYKDGPIIALDEPTAALDPIAENDIYQKYNSMTRGKTALFISHRLASTRFCDRIILLKNGTIIEQGTHDELMRQGGEYAGLFAVQSKYYSEGGKENGSEN